MSPPVLFCLQNDHFSLNYCFLTIINKTKPQRFNPLVAAIEESVKECRLLNSDSGLQRSEGNLLFMTTNKTK